jgi:hypothetical protein
MFLVINHRKENMVVTEWYEVVEKENTTIIAYSVENL